MKRGFFFTFEGIDGCGKTTQINAVAQRLEQDGYPVVLTREPGGTPIAEKIRGIIISPEHDEMHSECEVLLYLAARAQHVREKIIPALQEGKIVMCDRFQEATYAYQGFGRGLSMESLRGMNEFATGGLNPDLTFIFDISVELSRKRLAAMNKASDRLERSPVAFYERIRRGYQELSRLSPQYIVVLDGDHRLDFLTDTVSGKIREYLRLHSDNEKTGNSIAT